MKYAKYFLLLGLLAPIGFLNAACKLSPLPCTKKNLILIKRILEKRIDIKTASRVL